MVLLPLLSSIVLVAAVVKAGNVSIPVWNTGQYLYSWTPGGNPPTDAASGFFTGCNGAYGVIGQNAGEAVTFNFEGTQAWVTLWYDIHGGVASLYLDGHSVSNVTTASSRAATWDSACSTLVAGTPVTSYGAHKLELFVSNSSSTAGTVYWGPMSYDGAASESTTSALPTGTSTGSAPPSISTSQTPSTSPSPSHSSTNVKVVASGTAAVVVLLLVCFGLYFYRRRARSRGKSWVVDLDNDSDQGPGTVEGHPAALEAYQRAMPWRPPAMMEEASTSVPTTLPPSFTGVSADHKQRPDPSLSFADTSQLSTLPRASLSHGDLVQSLRNVPPEELSTVIRLLAADNPGAFDGLHTSSWPIDMGEGPPTYESNGTRS